MPAFTPPAVDEIESEPSFTPPAPEDIVSEAAPPVQGRPEPKIKPTPQQLPGIKQAGQALTYAGNVVRAIPADVAETVAGNEPYYELHNLAAAALGEPMPIDEALAEASKDSKTWATVGKISQGIAGTAPMLAIGGLPAAAQKFILAGFTAKMLKDAPDVATKLGAELGKPKDEQDPNVITDLVSAGIQDVGFGVAGAIGLRRGLQADAATPFNAPASREAGTAPVSREAPAPGRPSPFSVPWNPPRIAPAPSTATALPPPAERPDITGIELPGRPAGAQPIPPGAQNAIEARIEQAGRQPEPPRIAQGAAVPADVAQAREGIGEPSGNRNRPVGSPQGEGVPPQQPQPVEAPAITEEAVRSGKVKLPSIADIQKMSPDEFAEAKKGFLGTAAVEKLADAATPEQIEALKKDRDSLREQSNKVLQEAAKGTAPDKVMFLQAQKINAKAQTLNEIVETFEGKRPASKPPSPEQAQATSLPKKPAPTEIPKTIPPAGELSTAPGTPAGEPTVESVTPLDPATGSPKAPAAPVRQTEPLFEPVTGLGGAAREGEPQKPELAQLTDALRTMAEGGKKPELRRAYTLGEKLSQWKDSANSAVDGLKIAANYAKERLAGAPVWNDFKAALGRRQLAISEATLNARDFGDKALRGVPSALDREAIANWIDAGGDAEKLRQGLATTKDQYKAGYARALELPPELVTTAQNIQNYFESRLADAQAAGIMENGIEDYIHRMYEKDTPWKQGVLAELRSGVYTGKPSLAKQRVFQYDYEAEAAGYKPVKDFAKRVAAYDVSLNKAIADRQFVKEMMQWRMPDGRPAIDVAGVGVPIQGDAGEAGPLLIKPQFKPRDTTDPKNNRSDYIPVDHAALRKWKWVGQGAEGQPVMVQGDVLVHPDAVSRVQAVFGRSRARQYAAGRALLAVGSTVKQTMLDLSGFHPVQITVHGWEHRTFKPVEKIDLENPEQRALVSHGLVAADPHGAELFGEGLVGSSLTRHIPGIGPKLQAYNEWLFSDYIPRLKMAMGLHALERNRARFDADLKSGKMSEDQLHYLTAEQANAAFGEQNYEMMGRNKTLQDLLRIGLLAPDFLEARARFAGQAATKYGTEQRAALALGAATIWITARIVNKLLDDQYHFELKNAFSVVHNGRAYSLRTVQGDLLHAATDTEKFIFNRLNPLYGRTTMEAFTGRDAFGRYRTRLQQLRDVAQTLVPISLRGLINPKEQKVWESFLNAFGVTERRNTATDELYTLANKFKKDKKIGLPGEFIYDPERDPYRAVKIQLAYGKPDEAAQEMLAMVRDKQVTWPRLQSFIHRFATQSFTGSKANDKAFFDGLTGDQKKTYTRSLEERKKMRDKLRTASAIVNHNLTDADRALISNTPQPANPLSE